jgi:putative solute:sodium symporter small subunit
MTTFPDPPPVALAPADLAPPPAAIAAVTGNGTGAGDDAGATAQRQLVLAAARARHWQRTARLSTLLLLAWLVTTFCSAFFARELAGLTLFGWPLSFYLAAQGAALIYLAIVAVYALAMRRLDRDFYRRIDDSELVAAALQSENNVAAAAAAAAMAMSAPAQAAAPVVAAASASARPA